MPQVAVEKVNGTGKTLPIFEKIAQRFETVRRRAFELFEQRGREPGHDVEDWLKAEHELLGWPAAEFAEKDGAYEIRIALPGIDAKDVDVTATPTEILVRAATNEEKRTRKGDVLWTEFDSNEVYRRFQVPNPINADKVTATLENGILKINALETASKEIKAAAA